MLLVARPPPRPPSPAPPSPRVLLPQTSTRPSRSLLPRQRLGSAHARPALLLLLKVMENFNDWDLQAVVRSCSFAHAEEPAGAARHAVPAREAQAEAPAPAPAAKQEASRLYGMQYLNLDHKPFLLPPSTMAAAAASRAAGDDVHELMISITAASTSGVQSTAVPPGRNKAGARTPRPKRTKKSQPKKVVREMPVANGVVSSSDPWAWRKYGQKPIKGSPYPRGYYKCSSMKGCMARKLVERSPAKPDVLIVTYMAEHCHPVPTQLNALAGITRHTKSASAAGEDRPAASSPKSHEQQGPVSDEAAPESIINEASTAPVVAADQCGGTEEAAAGLAADDKGEFLPAGTMNLGELFATVDDDFDFFEPVLDDGDGVLGRRLSL